LNCNEANKKGLSEKAQRCYAFSGGLYGPAQGEMYDSPNVAILHAGEAIF